MSRHLILMILLASCKANPPVSSATDTTQFSMSPGTALSSILIIDYEDANNDIKAMGIVKKTYRYGAATSLIAPKDTIFLLINRHTYQSSEIEEDELIDNMHTGKPMKMLLKEQKKIPEKEDQSKFLSWKVLHIYSSH